MPRINKLMNNIRRGLAGTPAGSAAFYGAVATVRAEGLPTYDESRRDYHRMINSGPIYPLG